MSSARTFFEGFIETEYRANMAKFGAPDEELDDRIRELAAFYDLSGDMVITVSRARGMTAEKLRDLEVWRGRVFRRPLFQIKDWKTNGGELWGAYLGGTNALPRYESLLMARDAGQGLRLVSEYLLCLDCRTVKPDCPSCGGAGWNHVAGEKHGLRTLGKPVSVEKLVSPEGEESTDWEAS